MFLDRTSRQKEQVEALKWQMQRVSPKKQRKGGDVKRHLQLEGGATQETPREKTAMKFDRAQLLPVLHAVDAWTSRDRVGIERMTSYLARERQNVFAEMEEMERLKVFSVSWPVVRVITKGAEDL